MKFKNVKTGTTYYSIEIAKQNFCNSITRCMDCELSSKNNKKGVRCEEFCNSEPEMAAKIMGIEIIEEGDDKMETKKSYLAEILGLEEDEVFRLEGRNIDFRIHNGNREMWSEYERKWTPSACESELANIINKRNKIVKVKRLTEHEKKICEDCGAKWVSMDDVGNSVCLWEEKPVSASFCKNYSSGSLIATFRDSKRFPSVKPGDCIEVR